MRRTLEPKKPKAKQAGRRVELQPMSIHNPNISYYNTNTSNANCWAQSELTGVAAQQESLSQEVVV